MNTIIISVVELFHHRCPEHMVYISDSLKQKAYLLLERLEQEKHYFSEEWVEND